MYEYIHKYDNYMRIYYVHMIILIYAPISSSITSVQNPFKDGSFRWMQLDINPLQGERLPTTPSWANSP